MIVLSLEDGRLVLSAGRGDLEPRHESQLAFWGLELDSADGRLVSTGQIQTDKLARIVEYLAATGLAVQLSDALRAALEAREEARRVVARARELGLAFKNQEQAPPEMAEFLEFLGHSIPRRLKDHQVKAALHLLAVRNGANFSVPGSGKTSVVLSVFEWLRSLGIVDSLFVVGPPSCFGPWRHEYSATLGRIPSHEVLAGGDVDRRKSKYRVNRDLVRDLYLTSFQTLQHDWEEVRFLFEGQGLRFYLVVDEAHYIKRPDGAWAEAVLEVAGSAESRCILTGTPFPLGLSDAFNLFDVLWPEASPIRPAERRQIQSAESPGQVQQAIEVLDAAIGPLFYRVRKAELGLSEQDFHEPIQVPMKERERFVYDSILGRIRQLNQDDYFRDFDTLVRLRRGRMMRLRQCLSHPSLLRTAIADYSEELFGPTGSLADVIRQYDELETPAKMDALLQRVQELRRMGQKVVVWSNFVYTLRKITAAIEELGTGVRLIYGETPLESMTVDDAFTREAIIRDFVESGSGIDVLVANPAACAESISLHKTCAHAIYYDLSYNCAQYLQSLDRIHRVGGSEDTIAHYDFLVYEDTIDPDILGNVRRKADRMSQIVDRDYPIYSLDMFVDDDDREAYERIFGGEPV